MALTPERWPLSATDGNARLIYATPSVERYIWIYFLLRDAFTATKSWMLRHRADWP